VPVEPLGELFDDSLEVDEELLEFDEGEVSFSAFAAFLYESER
jgi:hypothetical protein